MMLARWPFRMPRFGGLGGTGGRVLPCCEGLFNEVNEASELSDWVRPSARCQMPGDAGPVCMDVGESERSKLARNEAV